ncbi:amino acid adenylation domain-containing protein [Micromonospora sp. NPDC000207]|uniref:non-ribosomal peptide synthetase n=1 Tax=Micromonospora sp. NPDC000207 TaxID=3154246 RepID=UPI00331D7D27
MSTDSTDQVIDAAARREALIRQRLAGTRTRRRDGIPRVDRGGRLPVSYGQQRLWFLTVLDPQSPEYAVPITLRVAGRLDLSGLGEAWHRLLERHEVLRTRYQLADAEPVQVVDPAPATSVLRCTDLTHLPTDEREPQALRLAAADAEVPFDVGREHPVRIRVVRLADDDHLLAVVFHHIAFDGWSMRVFINDLFTLYLQVVDPAAAPTLPPLPVQYADVAAWQRDRLTGATLDAQLGYWRDTLTGLAPLELPTDRPRPARRSWAGDRVVFTVPAELTGRLRDLARAHDTTLFTVGVTAYQELLARWSGQRDVAVGSAVAGRSRPEVEHLIGFLLNTVVLRARWDGDPTFADLLGRNRSTVLDAFTHQEAPVQFLVDDVERGRDQSRTPLFQVMYDMAESSPSTFTMPGLEVTAVDQAGAVAKHDLRLELTERPDGTLRGVVEYPTALFDAETVHRFAAQYRALLDAVARNPYAPLSAVDVLDADERARVLASGADRPDASPAPPRSVEAAVAAYAARTPDAVAVHADGHLMTYAQLHARANQTARMLHARGVTPGSVVGVCLNRGPDLVPTLLGVWRAGAAYVPVDPDDPAERMAHILDDAGAVLVVTEAACRDRIDAGDVFCVDVDHAEVDAQSPDDLPDPVDPQAVAYLVYTSGSTGRPKGVRVGHAGVANYLGWAAGRYLSADGNGAALFSSTAFDLVVTTLYLPLTAGQPVHLLPAGLDGHRLAEALLRAADDKPFSFLKLTPGHLDLLVHQLPADRAGRLAHHLVVGGEGFPTRLARRWWELAGENTTLVNEYGPTENTVANVIHTVRPPASDAALLPIGHATPGTTAYCLDAELRPQPIGVAGDLHLGGVQLAHGYHGLPAVTADRFVPDPYGPAGSRLYRTGDRARVLPDGGIEFLGRADDQLKVRGYRVEPGEVVAAMRRHPDVREAAVTLRETAAGARVLVGYVVAADATTPDVHDVREFLATALPEHMVPAHLVTLPELPLTSNGKVDLAALPDPDRAATAATAQLVGPRNPAEEQVAGVLRRTLDLADVGVDDDFFDLGGDSLSAVALVGDLRDLGLDLAVDDVFANPTVAGLAALAAERPAVTGAVAGVPPFGLISEEDRARLPEDVVDAFPVSMLQAGMVVEMMAGGSVNYYHNATTYQLRDDKPFDLPAFEAAVRLLVQRQDVLRTGFDLVGYSQPLQLIHRTAHLPTSAQDVRHLSPAEQDEVVRSRMAAERRELFDLAVPALLRLHAVVRTDSHWSLVITECHPIMEGWSYHLLLMELLTCYRQLRDGHPAPPQDRLGVRYADFIAAEQAALASTEDRDYWRGVVEGHSRFALPPGWQDGAGPGAPIRVEVMFHDLEEGLRELARTAEVPIKAVLHAAHLKVLSMLTDERRFFDGLVCDTRPEVAGADRLLGLFLNTVPFPFELTAPTWRHLVKDVFAQEIELWSHRRYPMPAMQREFSAGRRLVDVMFNYLDFRTVDTELVDFGASIDDSQIEFRLSVTAFRQGLINLRMHPEAISRANGERLAAMYRLVLAAMAADPDGDASATYLPADERRRLLSEWNETDVPVPATDLPTLFERQAAATPDAVAAVLADGRTLSYRELDGRANRLAHHLCAHGVGPDHFVGVYAEPGLELLVGILGAVKAGAAYLPLDPSHPSERLAFALRDAGASVLLTQDHLDGRLPPLPIPVSYLDGDWPAIAGHPDGPVPRRLHPDNLVYGIYTSGSTGAPKGVMVTHRGLVNYLTWAVGRYTHPGGGGAPMLGSVAFDLTVTNLLVPLTSGRTVTLLPPGEEVEAVARMLADGTGLDLVKLTPGHLDLLRGLLPSRTVVDRVGVFVVGGEQLPRESVLAWRQIAPQVTVVNEYGPTETVVGCIVHEVDADGDQAVPVAIGRPIANTRVYVLDDRLHPVPVGVPGELYLGGAGVARGYHDRPGLTAERFVPDPYGPPGDRLYRTGDVARYRDDGDLEFLGRADDQIKVRGYRIEPGEVESALLAHPSVAEAVVVAHTDEAGDRRLVGYVGCPSTSRPSVDELRDLLRRSLPEYMVPGLLVVLDTLPRSAAGKIDRRSLPSPDGVSAQTGTPYVASRNATERRLAEIWERVLGVDRIGMDDDLLDLGADSLSGLRVAAEAADLGLTMSPMDAVAYPTITELSRHLLGGDTAELTRRMVADSQLDATIRPAGPAAAPDGPLLLTGATGFVGAFLLRELLDRTDNPIVCLVRGADDTRARERLLATLRTWSVDHPAFADRVRVVAGDLGEPRLGLDPGRWAELAGSVAAIYHCGASVSAVHPYAAMRAVNIEGTREVIRLACTGPVTPLHHVSTMSVFTADTFDAGPVDERSVQVDPPSANSNGYGQTKWVAENLVREAARRGLPTTMYRMAKVSWDTATGVANPVDQFSRILSACLQLGCAPEADYSMTLTPVDRIAAGIVAVASRPEAVGGCYHLISETRVRWMEMFGWLTDAGHPVKLVDYDTWRDAVAAAANRPGGDHLKPLVMLMPRSSENFDVDLLEDDYVPPTPTWWAQRGGVIDPIRRSDFERFLARSGDTAD